MALVWRNGDQGGAARRARGPGRDRSRATRTEPDFAIPQAAADLWNSDASPEVALADADQPLAHRPGAAVDAKAAGAPVAPSRFWKAAIAVSCLLHLAVALAFVRFASDEVSIEGGEQAEVAVLGNAPEDQLAAGAEDVAPEVSATSVTLVTMLEARPVETAEATIVPVESVQPVDAAEVAEVAGSVVLEPVAGEAIEADRPIAQASETVAVAPMEPERPQTVPQQTAAATEPVEEASEPLSQVAASPFPEQLVASKLEPSSVDRLAPLASETPGEVLQPQVAVVTAQPVEEVIEPAPPVDAMQPAEPGNETTPLAPVMEQALAMPDEPVVIVAPVVERPQVSKAEPRPEPARERKPKPAKAEKPARTAKPAKPEKAMPDKARSAAKERPTGEKPERPAAARSGSKGSNQADARRGAADGAANGRSSATGSGARQSKVAGNAAVSNYPGKVVSKLRRALRYPAEARSRRLRGEVQVTFTVSASGAVSGIRVVRGSGSPVLDRAALETVRRAAPFPAIPDAAGRSSWPFTVPLAFSR